MTGMREATIFSVDLAAGIHQAAGSVEAQQDRGGVAGGGLIQRVADDLDGDGTDDAVDIDRDHAGGRGEGKRGEERNQESRHHSSPG